MPDFEIRDPRDNFFDLVWAALAAQSNVDGLGGAEYRRVIAEWIAAGRPVGVAEFMYTHANTMPPAAPTT